MPKDKQNTERISTFISKELVDKLKEEAEEKGLTMSSLIRSILIQHTKKGKEKG